ncbi:bifunctional diaminohydroxyphosphoribosylaminopyrimidine deaminase/5-amino-6-(5-phosphoribosylamino)uracil reductase RibD [Actinoplanes solisilvae]|uniref:bifunctional diaminohydroxyphosphoribosylaminopyrimidine deaminase/5-amino-6-(5-phosphoribosylamino)uracil reductase RibD n=1 Tax=Actinoplanes solisilvae TaxID=2486853 RepID=UPI001F0B7B47|nr:bifunctional diaminohydroxyphosphoribosylaminopyrimidine deaminase/5-amino-6-(5-phosphoribosylamino)uracil reductase RibD [Actinoplanes solisilvae]
MPEQNTKERFGMRRPEQAEIRDGFAPLPGYGLGGLFEQAEKPGEARDDAYWMRRALLRAMAAEGGASPNPTVGAVIVKDGELIAEGSTERYGGRHAERCAIDNVADRSVLRGATIYTTLEPCAHWGRQPPCADLVATCGFARCVAGLRDPNPEVAGVGLARVRSAGTEVSSGVLRNELIAWHLPYLVQRITGRALVSLIVAEGRDSAYRARLHELSDLVITDDTTAIPSRSGPPNWIVLDGPPARDEVDVIHTIRDGEVGESYTDRLTRALAATPW